MSRGLTTAMIDGFKAGLPMAHLWEFQFASATERVWTGHGGYDLTFGGNTYRGLDGIVGFNSLEIATDNVPSTVQITVRASSPTVIGRVLDPSETEGRLVTMWTGLIDETTRPPSLVADPYIEFRRLMTGGAFNRAKLTWVIRAEPLLVQQTRGVRRVRTYEDQRDYAEENPFVSPNFSVVANDQGFIDVERSRRRVTWPAPRWDRQLGR